MNVIDRATIIHYHRQRIASFGVADPRALGWRGSESQRKRFEVIAAAAGAGGETLLDLGCGCGDLKAYLDERRGALRYLGVDQVPEFIEQAQARFAHCPRSRFQCADFTTAQLPRSDIVVACGALGYRCAAPDFHLRMIGRMWAACAGVLIVNLLDARTFPAHHPLLVGQDVGTVMACARSLTPRAELIQGYLEDDFTLVLRRRRANW